MLIETAKELLRLVEHSPHSRSKDYNHLMPRGQKTRILTMPQTRNKKNSFNPTKISSLDNKTVHHCLDPVAFVKKLRSIKELRFEKIHFPEELNKLEFVDCLFKDCTFSSLNGDTFKDCTFTASDFTDNPLRNVDFERAYFKDCKFATLEDTGFKDSSLVACALTCGYLVDADFFNTAFNDCDLREATLIGVNIKDCQLTKNDFTKADILSSKLEDSKLEGNHFLRAHIGGSWQAQSIKNNYSLANAQKLILDIESEEDDFTLIDLSQAEISKGSFIKSTFTNANLVSSQIHNIPFRKCDFKGTLFNEAIIQGSSMKDCSLLETNFTNANLDNLDLRGSKLHKTRFIGAHTDFLRVDDDQQANMLSSD